MGKPQFFPTKFDIDVSVCMSCQICVEVCPFEAIKMDTAFELSTDDRFGGLLWNKEKLARSNEYYHSIHPTEAAEVDAGLAEKKAKHDGEACRGKLRRLHDDAGLRPNFRHPQALGWFSILPPLCSLRFPCFCR